MAQQLCQTCSSLTISSFTEKLQNPPVWWHSVSARSPSEGRIHHPKNSDLLKSAELCHLCKLMQVSLENDLIKKRGILPINELHGSHGSQPNKHDASGLEQALTDQPLYLTPKHDDVRTMWPEGCGKGAEIRGLLVCAPIRGGVVLIGILRIWSFPNSLAKLAGDVAGRPQLVHSGTPDAHTRVARWLQACIDDHPDCRKLLSGQSVDENLDQPLPARVIDVGQASEELEPRLVESVGMHAPYVALSHCWGSPSKPPLRTILSKLHSFMQSIPWQELPKTFQDAAVVTRALGMRYLWIDSLCIVQDDINDWKKEAVKMGAVYEQARLTIAASHASNSHDGLFLVRPPLPTPLELPYIDSQGQIAGSFFVSQYFTDFDAISPENGALNTRAWATQEWLLSRRMAFYTAQSIMWSCKTITQRETGERCRNTARNPKWKTVVEHYSARHLTQSGDKLMALEGLKNTLAKRLNDEYVLGVWRQCLPDQLLWRVRTTRNVKVNTLGLPSWTWASTDVAVRFLDIKGAKNNCAGFAFQNDRLFVKSRLRPVGSFVELARSNQPHGSNTPAESIDSNFILSIAQNIPAELIVQLNDDVGNPLGWAVPDEPELQPLPLCCLLLMSNTDRRSRERLALTSPTGSTTRSEDWVLILQKQDPQSEHYVRVGVGKVYSTAWWDSIPIGQVCIV